MATFKEIFAKRRKELGAGKTFVWSKSEGGDGKSYSTNYAEEEKKPTGTKLKAKPTGLNPQSGASRSTAGKVAAKESVSGASRSVAGKVPPKTSTAQQKAAYGANRPTSMDGVSRKPDDKPKPKMSQTELAMAEAKAAKAAKDAATKKKKPATTTTTVPTAAVKPLTKLMQILSQGGFSKYKG